MFSRASSSTSLSLSLVGRCYQRIMGRNSMLKGLDAFGKTMDDVKVKTGFGGILTLFSFFLILLLTLVEFVDYRRVTLHPSIVSMAGWSAA